MEIRGTNALRPDWDVVSIFFELYLQIRDFQQFDFHEKNEQYVSYLLNVLEIDSMSSTRPISIEIKSAEEIQTNIEPVITYGKGSAVVRMLTYVLGVETFDKGITVKYPNFLFKSYQKNSLICLYSFKRDISISLNIKMSISSIYGMNWLK